MKQIKIKLDTIKSDEAVAEIQTELEVLEGVEKAEVEKQKDVCRVEYNDEEISGEQIIKKIEELGYRVNSYGVEHESAIKEHLYYVKGMHCASCEILIEKRFLKIKGIKSVEASTSKSEVLVEYDGKRPKVEELNKIFQEDHYVFSEESFRAVENEKEGFFKTFGVAIIIIVGFLLLNKFGLSSLINVSSRSSLIAFFFFGILAGLSTCAALVGGLVLSMSKQWLAIYSDKDTTWQKLQPHLMFNAGRLISYGLLGAVLGGIGSKLNLSLTFSSILVVVVSVLMFFLALQMLGVKSFRRFQIATPKFITRKVADESKFQGKRMPFLMGALTFFLPCGFTITTQGLALLSGSAIQGGLIMFFFALGTVPILIAIGLSSINFSSKKHFANRFLKVAGALVLFFALFNINAQLNVLGFKSFTDIFSKTNLSSQVNANQIDDQDLAPIVDAKQVIKMDASSNGYTPNYFKVRTGLPVRWEITDKGTSGCTNAVLSRGLFDGQIELTPGSTSVKEFTPQKAGQYKFSCWMGMISGLIEVVDSSTSSLKTTSLNTKAVSNNQAEVVPSGASGCGCGGGGNGSCQTASKSNTSL